MNITDKLKERFVRDFRIPIRLYKEPYFSERLALYDKQFGTLQKWADFIQELEKFQSEDEYIRAYNSVKDNAIQFIKSTAEYQAFNQMDMSQYAIQNKNFSNHDVFHYGNIGRRFLSIDMKKANFNALRTYSPKIFDDAETWEEFMSKFTDNKNIINSKYIRQVILGNCNPDRHIKYEKHFMDILLTDLLENGIPLKIVKFFSNDEIVLDITDFSDIDIVRKCVAKSVVPLRIEDYVLLGVEKDDHEIIGFIRELSDGSLDFKGFKNYTLPLVLRHLQNEELTESDLIFEYEGYLSRFIEKPNVHIMKTL